MNNQNLEAKSNNEDDAEQNQGSNESWPACGLPDYVIGNNFAGLPNLEQVLGIKISIAPVHAPFFKSSIERFFRTTDSALITSLRGTIDVISVETDADPTDLLDP